MKLVATFHSPTSVSHSITCTLTNDEDVEYLIVAKTSVLEVYAILPDALSLQSTFEVWGRISSLNALTFEDDSRQYILVTTDHPDPSLLALALDTEDSSCTLKCISSLSLHERGARPAEFYNDCLVDQRNNVAVISSYVGKLKVVECNNGKFDKDRDFDASIRELNVLSMCFIQTNSTRTSALAILHQDHTKKLVLTSHELSVSDRDLSSATSAMLANVVIPETDSNLILSVPPHGRNSWNSNGGILVLGGSRILFYSIDRKQKRKSEDKSAQRDREDRKSAIAEIAWPYAEITAWCKIDHEGFRYLLGDSFGRLLLLALDQASPKINLLFLGEISPPTSLTPLSSQYVFVGSHFGDSQLIRIIPDKSSITGSFVDVADSFRNIAPIMDAVVVDPDGSGESRIVTCSGGKNTGSLRLIQNGANFDVNATLDGIPNITNMFSLKTEFAAEHHTHLLATTAASTHLLRFPSDRDAGSTIIRVTDFHMQYDSPTLACANIMTRFKKDGRSMYESGPFVVQVTPETVLLLNMSLGTTESQWSPGNTQEIVLADISPSQICLALSNGEVVILTVLENAFIEYTRKTFFGPNGEALEASALTFIPPKTGRFASDCIIVGFWETKEVKAYSLPALELRKELSASFPYLPTSVVLHDFGNDATRPLIHLLVGLGDGSLHSFSFTEEGLDERKVVSLGDLPVSLIRCRVDGLSTVLATSTRASLFFWQKDALHNSPVLVKELSASAALHTRTFGESLVLASQNGLVIGRILELDKLHIRTVSLGPNVPVKISYHPLVKAFGVGCLKTEISDPLKLGKISSSVKVVDAAALSQLYEYDLNEAEEVASLCTARLDLRGNEKSYFAVGTMFFDDMESEPSRGRVLLFDVDGLQDGSVLPHLASQTEIKGCAYALASQNGKLVAAVNTGVVLFGLQESLDGYNNVELVERDAWHHNYLVTNLVIRDNFIIIGDAVNSVAILEIANGKIVLKARDFGPLWPLSLEASDKSSIIGANSDDNLFTLKLVGREDKYVLERDGCFFMGETVNKFVPGSLSSSAGNAALQPQQLFFTSTGRIGVILDVDEALSLKLSGLQRNVAGCIKGPGNIDHATWRAPKNSRGRSDAQMTSFGFLDGDFLERFLNYSSSSPTPSKILAGSNDAERLDMSYMDVRTILESIRSMH